MNPDLKKRLITDLDTYLTDNTRAWELQADGSYGLLEPPVEDVAHSAQAELLAQLAEHT